MTVYEACVKNCKKLKSEQKILCRLIKQAIREHKDEQIKTYTFLLALLYSSFAEASFLKLIYTPDGFSDTEISQILDARNLENKWEKCFELALKKVLNSTNAGEIANKKQQLTRILHEHIIEPSQLRNKIAHGQWVACLNNECTNYNDETTKKLNSLDPVYIMREFNIYMYFVLCIEYIIVSPQKAHPQYYYKQYQDLIDYIKKTDKWDLSSFKKEILQSQKMDKYKKYRESTT